MKETIITFAIFMSIIGSAIWIGNSIGDFNNKTSWSEVLKEKPVEMKATQERFKSALRDLEDRSK